MGASGKAWGLLGGLLGWLTHPAVWLVAGPFRWSALLYGTISQESDGVENARNPERQTSLGICQFQTDTWNTSAPGRWATATPEGTSEDPRLSPFKSGYVATCYVQDALTADLRWLAIAPPVVGFAMLRLLWTGGIGSIEYGTFAEALDRTKAESRAWPAFIKARAFTLGLMTPILVMVARSRRKVRDL